uniref:protein RADIALIS-like 3 n=1 Tax=Erigeron canadensis TaxID=72917 RepID=UPI001CB9D481|nr:protein RADIALIS-like 3 [Erigeron canadensis]
MPKIQETDSISTWTRRENKLFENALASQDEDAPDRWQNIAKATGKAVEEVKAYYQLLVEDLKLIESDQVPIPNYIEHRHERADCLKRKECI